MRKWIFWDQRFILESIYLKRRGCFLSRSDDLVMSGKTWTPVGVFGALSGWGGNRLKQFRSCFQDMSLKSALK